MRTIILSILLILSMKLCAQNAPEKLKPFSCGSIKPTGWLKEQMKKDIDGFVGNLDLLVPGLFQDPIYGKDRLQKHSKVKDLGNSKEGDAEGDAQYQWWNSETLLMPNILKTKIHDIDVEIENITDYPFQNEFKFKIKQSQSIPYTIKIRKPHWVTKIRTSENFRIENQFIVINRIFSDNDIIQFNFETDVLIKADTNGRHYFSYGVLIYALPIKSVEIIGKNYGNNFTDYTYKPISNIIYTFQNGIESKFNNNKIETQLINPNTNTSEHVELIPFGKTILRQVTF